MGRSFLKDKTSLDHVSPSSLPCSLPFASQGKQNTVTNRLGKYLQITHERILEDLEVLEVEVDTPVEVSHRPVSDSLVEDVGMAQGCVEGSLSVREMLKERRPVSPSERRGPKVNTQCWRSLRDGNFSHTWRYRQTAAVLVYSLCLERLQLQCELGVWLAAQHLRSMPKALGSVLSAKRAIGEDRRRRKKKIERNHHYPH